MPKQTETLSVFLLTGSDEEDPPSSAAVIGLPRLQLHSLQLVLEMFLVHFCPHVTHFLFSNSVKQSFLVRQIKATMAPEVQQY